MTMLLQDPPELAQYAARGDPPMSMWPGTWVNERFVMAACGDERDWFRYWHRHQAYARAWAEFCDARRRRRKFSSGFDWNQVLIIGDFGAKKTTLGIKVARYFFGLGHPVFSNASCLFGWHLPHETLYTSMAQMPKNSVLLIDESSAALASRVAHGVAISTFVEMSLNTRKQNCYTILMSAQDRDVAASVRHHCREVWRPLGIDALTLDAPSRPIARQSENPNNFAMGWDVWDDYPYRRSDIIEGRKEDAGFGPPSATWYDEGEAVRNAYLLNDTFQLAQVGAATTADREIVKADIANFLQRNSMAGEANQPLNRNQANITKMTTFFLDQMASNAAPAFFRSADVARALDIDAAAAGKLIQRVFPVQPTLRHGYRAAEIFDHISRMEAAAPES